MAQNDSEKYISGAILQGGGIPNVPNNKPAQYADRQRQYMAGRTRLFPAVRAKYATDYVQARVQGISKEYFYKWYRTNVRLANMHSTPTLTQQTDDTKIVLFDEPKIDYFPIGAKIETMGNVWICTNPSNISSPLTTAVVRRCNASYNLFDYYGNIVTEPIVLEKVTMMGNDNVEKPQNLVLMDGYFNVICQLNENTRQLGLNQRIILGEKAYFITGFMDFHQEFSGDYDSTHILYFTVRIEEPKENDDVPNRIANGKTYSFAAEIKEGQRELNVGDTLDLTAIFLKNGIDASTLPVPYNKSYSKNMVEDVSFDVNLENGWLYVKHPSPYVGSIFGVSGEHDEVLTESTPPKMQLADFHLSEEAVKPTDGELRVSLLPYVNFPITWIWESDDPDIAEVDENGRVTARSDGMARITAYLAQNTAISATVELVVKDGAITPYVAFNGVIPKSIEALETATLTATYYGSGAATDKPIEWSFSGADKRSYAATVKGNSVEICCYLGDDTPLTVTATCEGKSATATIELLGL